MTENYKIIGSFIKDMSSETPDAPTYIFVRDKISKYRLNIDINSRAVKDGIIEVNTMIKFSDQPEMLKKAHFEQQKIVLNVMAEFVQKIVIHENNSWKFYEKLTC